MGPGGTGGGGPPNQTVGSLNPPMSPLLQRLQTPVRSGAPSVMVVGQRPTVDVMGTRAPNVTAGTHGHPTAGPGNVMNIIQPGNSRFN